MTLAQQLKSMSLPGTPAYRAAEAMAAAEVALAEMLECYLDVDGSDGALETAAKEQARAALAKLRGEA
jgi:hypothetical protein